MVILRKPLRFYRFSGKSLSALGAPGLATCGGVFRNSRGFVQGCFSIKMGIAFAFEAELLAAILAIEAAAERNWCHLWLECDSTYVVNLLKSKSKEVPWPFETAGYVSCSISRTCFLLLLIFLEKVIRWLMPYLILILFLVGVI